MPYAEREGPFIVHTSHFSERALEAELVDRRRLLLTRDNPIIGLQPHAPLALLKAGKGGKAFAPLNHEALEVTRALLPHPSRRVQLHRRKQPCVAQPLRPGKLAGVFGRKDVVNRKD